MKIDVILTPAEIATLPGRDLAASTAVVFDVLRATSTILAALANGAAGIRPVATLDEAWALRKEFPDALVGGEREGVKVEGFAFGNSPLEYTRKAVEGR
jgi:2-phosphosulfolactate phosphatase